MCLQLKLRDTYAADESWKAARLLSLLPVMDAQVCCRSHGSQRAIHPLLCGRPALAGSDPNINVGRYKEAGRHALPFLDSLERQ